MRKVLQERADLFLGGIVKIALPQVEADTGPEGGMIDDPEEARPSPISSPGEYGGLGLVLEEISSSSQREPLRGERPQAVVNSSGLPSRSLLIALREKAVIAAILAGALLSTILHAVLLPDSLRLESPTESLHGGSVFPVLTAMDLSPVATLGFRLNGGSFLLDYANYAAEASIGSGLRRRYGQSVQDLWPDGLIQGSSELEFVPSMYAAVGGETSVDLGVSRLVSERPVDRSWRVRASPLSGDRVLITLETVYLDVPEVASVEAVLHQKVSSLDWMVNSAREDLATIEALVKGDTDEQH